MVCETKIVATEDHEALPGAKKDTLLAAAGAMWPPLPAAPGPAAAPPPAPGPQPHGGTGGAGPPEGRGVCIREFRAAEQEAARRIFYDGILERIPNTAFRGLRQHPRIQLLYALLAGQCAAGGRGPAGLPQSRALPGPALAGPADPLRGPSRLAPPSSPSPPLWEPGCRVGARDRRGGDLLEPAAQRSAALRAYCQGAWAGRGNWRRLSAGAADREALGQQLSPPRCPFSPSRGIPGGGGVTGQVALQLRPGATTIYNLRAGEAA